MYFVFDLDGTLANIDHRVHHVRGDKKDFDTFFKECIFDLPKQEIIDLLKTLVSGGHRVEIWSGRSAIVENETCGWLDFYVFDGASKLLKHMRPEGNYITDHVLKKSWLDLEDQKPDMIFDDRQQVVDMWRREGITCAQVASWEDRPWKPNEKIVNGFEGTLLNVIVGPSGAGKSTLVAEFPSGIVVSSDLIRGLLCGDWKDQSRNQEVFQIVHETVDYRLRRGLPTIVDATNLKTADRLVYPKMAERISKDIKVRYIVVNRPMDEKIRDAGWRKDVKVKDGRSLIEYHEQIFQSNLKDILAGDNMPNVIVDTDHFEGYENDKISSI